KGQGKNQPQAKNQTQAKNQPKPPMVRGKVVKLPTVEGYEDFRAAVEQSGAKFDKAVPDQVIDLGGGANLTVLAPTQPFFTRDQMISSRKGNESNANSIVMRLVYGDFSMLLAGDGQSEGRQALRDQAVARRQIRCLDRARRNER